MKFDTIIIDEAAQAGQRYPFALGSSKMLWCFLFLNDIDGQIPIKSSFRRYAKQRALHTCIVHQCTRFVPRSLDKRYKHGKSCKDKKDTTSKMSMVNC